MLCMLTTVHEPHFLFLAARLTLQRHFQRGRPPPHVVVFDDSGARTKFCGAYGLCGSEMLSHPLALKLILRQTDQSDGTYLWLRKWLNDGSRRDHGPTQSDARGCTLRSHARVYQSIKKVLGALSGPPECSAYFVADAESLPFRPYHWQQATRSALHAGAARHLTATWGPDCGHAIECPRALRQCAFKHSLYRDPQCEWGAASALGLAGAPSRLEFWQRVAQPDQFWLFSREMLRHLVRRVETAGNASFARAFPVWRIELASLYNLMAIQSAAEAARAGTPPMQPLLNLPLELHRALPEAYASWSERPRAPCVYMNDVFSSCLVKAAGVEALARLVTGVLGVFGYWHQAARPGVDVALAGEPQLAWCVNNCFNAEMLARLSQVPERNRTLQPALAASALVRSAFKQEEGMAVLGGGQDRTARARDSG